MVSYILLNDRQLFFWKIIKRPFLIRRPSEFFSRIVKRPRSLNRDCRVGIKNMCRPKNLREKVVFQCHEKVEKLQISGANSLMDF